MLHSQATTGRVFYVGEGKSPVTSLDVLRIWKLRKSRCDYFPETLFADPAWDILLHLYATDLAGQRSTVTQAVLGSNVPEATALRYLRQLFELGLCEKTADLTDRRRLFVNLTDAGVRAMDNYFTQMRSLGLNEVFTRAA
jgi:DNA-binding MarR family transcriptional regulator